MIRRLPFGRALLLLRSARPIVHADDAVERPARREGDQARAAAGPSRPSAPRRRASWATMRDPRPGLRWSRRRVQRREQYGGYMDSPAWFRRRERWLQEFAARATAAKSRVCVVCGAKWTLRHGDLHHRTYARLGAETWQDLVPMCRDHHDALTRRDGAAIPPGERLPREQATDLIVAYLRSEDREEPIGERAAEDEFESPEDRADEPAGEIEFDEGRGCGRRALGRLFAADGPAGPR